MLFDVFDLGMLTANGETHRRRRSPFSRTFAHRMITELRPHIRQAAEELIADWYATEAWNLSIGSPRRCRPA